LAELQIRGFVLDRTPKTAEKTAWKKRLGKNGTKKTKIWVSDDRSALDGDQGLGFAGPGIPGWDASVPPFPHPGHPKNKRLIPS
jgi:hypothetical protein